MNHCETCRHWHKKDGDYGQCRHPKVGLYPEPSDDTGDNSLLLTHDWGSVETGRHFGCVHHEKAADERCEGA